MIESQTKLEYSKNAFGNKLMAVAELRVLYLRTQMDGEILKALTDQGE